MTVLIPVVVTVLVVKTLSWFISCACRSFAGRCLILGSVFVLFLFLLFIVRVGIVRRSFSHQRLDVIFQLLGFQLKSSVCVGCDDVCLNSCRCLLGGLQVRKMEDHIRRYLRVGDDGTIRELKIELFEDIRCQLV